MGRRQRWNNYGELNLKSGMIFIWDEIQVNTSTVPFEDVSTILCRFLLAKGNRTA